MDRSKLSEEKKRAADALQAERDNLVRSGRLQAFQWFVILFSVVLTFSAWHFARSQVENRRLTSFERETEQLIGLVTDRMERYADALHSGVATIAAFGGSMTHQQWREFAQGLKLETNYPGVNGLGVIMYVAASDMAALEQAQRDLGRDYTHYPAHDFAEKFPIVYIEPEAANAAAVGLDVAHETNRRRAALMARDTGLAQVTGPIVLVQDAKSTPGFLFYAPYYATPDAAAPDSLDARRRQLTGLVYAPFIVNDLIAGTLDEPGRPVGLRLLDDEDVLFDENTAAADTYDPAALYTAVIDVPLFGRTWTFDLRSTKAFRVSTGNFQPLLLLVAGLIGNALLLTMFLALTRARREALVFADRVNEELVKNTEALTRSNSELESFAYIASHDLRTPVRGIGHISEYLREDLEPYLASDDCPPDVPRNLDRIDRQASRMNALIEGILAYSRVGGQDQTVAPFDINECVADLRETLQVDSDQLAISDPIPAFNTYNVRLQQVIANLVGNAFKYHHEPAAARVTVSCAARGQRYVFSVRDNGPGIEPQYHDKIFDVFRKLETKDMVEGSGVGLSIVKRAVEFLGGHIRVTSVPGAGANFEFDWPKSVLRDSEQVNR